jgi:hypothetical protein
MKDFLRDMSLGKTKQWLYRKGKSSRLLTLHLTQVSHPLDADALWDASTSNDRHMRESLKQRHDLRLRQALQAHQFARTVYKAGVPIPRNFVFADVVVWVAESVWRDANRDGGEGLFFMSERLYFQHRQAFSQNQKDDKDNLYLGRPPHYAIMPLPGLPENEVICQFGQGVFLPSAEDEMERTASITIRKDGVSSEPPPWIFFERMKGTDGVYLEPTQFEKVTRPAGLYSRQTMLLLGRKLENAALVSPLWVNASDEGEIVFNGTAREPEIYGDDIHLVSGDVERQGGQTRCRFISTQSKQDSLTLILDRDEARFNSTRSSTTYYVEDDDGDFSGLTHIDVADETPDYTYTLKLTGIILPKTSNISPPLAYWQLSLDENGEPIVEGEKPTWHIKGCKDGLFWQTHEKSDWHPLKPDEPIPFLAKDNVILEQAVLPDKQFAILPVEGMSIPIMGETVLLGREMTDITDVDVPLGLLRSASTLVYADGSQHNSLESLGLSARHIQVALRGFSLHIRHLGKNSKTYITQKNGELRAILGMGERCQETDVDADAHLLIGPFRFRVIEKFRYDRQD